MDQANKLNVKYSEKQFGIIAKFQWAILDLATTTKK